MAFPEAWTELAKVAIARAGVAVVDEPQFALITENIEINQGDTGGEGIPVLNGGRIWKQMPAEDDEITLEHIPIELDSAANASGTGLFQQFMTTGAAAYDASEPLTTPVAATTARERDRFRVVVMWTNDSTSGLEASGATAASTDSLRFVMDNARLISLKHSFADGILKATATFKAAKFKKDGTPNTYWQSGDQTALVALSAFT